jgi:hypothetical protein
MKRAVLVAPVVVWLMSCATAAPPAGGQAQAQATLLFKAVDGQRGEERRDVRMQTTVWERVPRVLRTSATPVAAGWQRVTLAGDPGGTGDFRIDNFILLEVLDESGARVSSGLVGNVVDCTGPVLLDGRPVPELGPKSFTIPGGAVDLSQLFPAGKSVTLRATALDYGGAAYVSDVYLIVR